ncbi:hypothetical protein REPUB_Repub12eG0101400 [Reevesia pubescens]
MVYLSTWCRYLVHKLEYSFTLSWKSYKRGQISDRELQDAVWKNLFQGKLTYLHWNKGEAMAPTIGEQGGTLLVRKIPAADPSRVFVGDVVVLKDPDNSDNYLVRRLAATAGYEMVSKNEKDEPFVLEKDQCWVLADNENLKPKEAKDSRLFGPVPMTGIVGRVIYCLRTAVDHGPVQNSHYSMQKDSPVLEVELDVDDMVPVPLYSRWLICLERTPTLMSHALHLVSNNVPGYGPTDCRYLSCSGISGRAVTLSPCSSHSDHRVCSLVKVRSLKCGSRGIYFVCRAGSSGHRRNPDFSRQRHEFRGRNRQNEDREKFENLDESEMLSSKNGPLLSLSGSTKYQATAAPGPKEKEIVELFRKVQAKLRERAAAKEGKKTEALHGKAKESETVDSLLKLLRKHSVEQGKKKNSIGSSGDLNLDHPEVNGSSNEDKSSGFFDSNDRVKTEAKEPYARILSRPASNFRRKLPVPQMKYRPIYSSEEAINSVTHVNSDREKILSLPEPPPALDHVPELEEELESETEPELEPESIYQDPDLLDELSEDESSGVVEEDGEQEIGHEDLTTLKLPELRALAKSRGLKGFSKMKKSDLVLLLSSSSG